MAVWGEGLQTFCTFLAGDTQRTALVSPPPPTPATVARVEDDARGIFIAVLYDFAMTTSYVEAGLTMELRWNEKASRVGNVAGNAP